MSVSIVVSYGELIDKISILRLKSTRITDARKLRNVNHELALLEQCWEDTIAGKPAIDNLIEELQAVNAALWDIEDRLRVKETMREFDSEFIELARGVYFTNDRRAALKRAVNEALGSQIVEEKQYISY